MKRCLPFIISAILFTGFSAKADFGIWASAVYLNVNGTSSFYNTQKTSGSGAIGVNTFSNNLGVFGNNSGTLKILGAEIKTGKENGAAICGGVLYYIVYQRGERPTTPVFSSIQLSLSCNCNGSTFSSCGGGACNSTSDQKWQNITDGTDLSALPVGNYTLEVYYQVSGENSSGGCNQLRQDNNNGTNYKADFSITTPLALNFSTFTGNTTENSVRIKWSIQNDADILKYEVQKSDNGLTFSPLWSIDAIRTGTPCNYYYNDADPIIGSNYYRVKLYNANNTVTLSHVVRIYFGKVGNTIFIYPNPSGSELAVRFAAVHKGRYQMSIFGTNGQRILTQQVMHDGVDKTIRIQMPQTMAKGIYRLFLIDKIEFYKQSFLVR